MHRPPNVSFVLIYVLFTCLDVLCNINFSFSICGDFKMSHINCCNLSQNFPKLKKFCIKFVIDNALFQLVTFPTRKFNILDLLLVDDKYLTFNRSYKRPFWCNFLQANLVPPNLHN